MGEGKLTIKEAALFVCKVKVGPLVQLAHINALKRGNAKFPINRVEVRTFSIPRVNLNVNYAHLFLGRLRNRIVIHMVENPALIGNSRKKTFHFNILTQITWQTLTTRFR